MTVEWKNTDPRVYAHECNRDYMSIVILRPMSSRSVEAAMGEVYVGCGFEGPHWNVYTDFKNEGEFVGFKADQEWNEDWRWTLEPR